MATGVLAWGKLLESLYDLYDEVNSGLDWLIWSQTATGNVQIGKAPPPSPTSPEEFQEALDRTRKQVNDLPLPTFETLLPDNGNVPTTGFDATRSAIRGRISNLSNCVTEIDDAKSAITYFSTLANALNKQMEMLRRLAEVMWQLAEKFPVKILVETLGFEAINIEGSYIPFVQETANKVVEKQIASKSALEARLAKVRSAANAIKNLLTVEAIDLRVALGRLEQLDAEVLKLQEVVAMAVERRTQSVANVQRAETLRDAGKMDVAETEERLESKRERVFNLDAQIKQLTEQIDRPFVCPVGASWNDCVREDHIPFKNSYIENRNALINQRSQRQVDLKAARDAVVETSKDLTAVRAQLVQLEGRLTQARDVLKVDEERLNNVRNELKAKALFLTEEKHRLRADIFAAENRSDEDQVAAVTTRLGAAP